MADRRNTDEWHFTKHALERAVDMALDPEELREAIERPTRPLSSMTYPGCHLIHTERIVLCVNLSERKVITVIWNTFDGQRNVRFDRDDIERCRDLA